MALELPTTKRQRLLIIVLVVVILITVMMVWWGMAPSKEVTPVFPEALEVGIPEGMVEKIPTKLDLSVFDHPWFEKAKIHGDLPVEAGETGRENPFRPY